MIENWKLSTYQALEEKEAEKLVRFLRKKWYPKPEDCPMEKCNEYRPACKLGICFVATLITGDF